MVNPKNHPNRSKQPRYFTVTGSGDFPFDMLRYDECWPYQSEDAVSVGSTPQISGGAHFKRRSVRLMTNNPHAPTAGRWSSFTWKAEPGIEVA